MTTEQRSHRERYQGYFKYFEILQSHPKYPDPNRVVVQAIVKLAEYDIDIYMVYPVQRSLMNDPDYQAQELPALLFQKARSYVEEKKV